MNVERKSLFLKEVNILRGKMHDKLLKNDASKMGQSHQSCIRTIKEQMWGNFVWSHTCLFCVVLTYWSRVPEKTLNTEARTMCTYHVVLNWGQRWHSKWNQFQIGMSSVHVNNSLSMLHIYFISSKYHQIYTTSSIDR